MLPSLEKQGTGPRAVTKKHKYREIAQATMEKEREKIRAQKNDSPYEKNESTATLAQAFAVNYLTRSSCLNVSSEKDLETMPGKSNDEAITYWSHELKTCGKPHFPVTSLKRGTPLFARCTSFSNDIENSQLRQSGGDETCQSVINNHE